MSDKWKEKPEDWNIKNADASAQVPCMVHSCKDAEQAG